MDGQATRGTKLNKGDGMSYTYSGKKAGSVSVSCGVSYAGVGASVSIKLPTPKSVSQGTVSSVTRVAQSSGRYKLYGKLKYKITTKTTYQRNVKFNYNPKTKKVIIKCYIVFGTCSTISIFCYIFIISYLKGCIFWIDRKSVV